MEQVQRWLRAVEQVKTWSKTRKTVLVAVGVVIFVLGLDWIDGAEYRELGREIGAAADRIEQINVEQGKQD